jgi:hypothetical protein
MAPPPTPEIEIRRVADLHNEWVDGGGAPYGSGPNGGAAQVAGNIAAVTGWSIHAVQYRLKLAKTRVLLRFAPLAAGEKPRVRVKAVGVPLVSVEALPDKIAEMLRLGARTVEALSKQTGASPDTVDRALRDLQANGMRIEHSERGAWRVSKAPIPAAYLEGPLHSFVTDADNTFTFGACGDQHMCSKYERLDVNEALYDAYAEAGVRTVFNTGNWIDGEARFNKHDLHTHGMAEQVRYLAKNYPRRAGIRTYAVAGDDHEGWYAQSTGVDIGRYAEQTFVDEGRSDWTNLGYMEAPVRIVNANSGKEAILSVVHPGGGSSYALSYAIQKIIESLDGGEKPAIGLYGHYHKMWQGNIRNVWCVQTGCGQDQTPFMRKKKLEAHVGGYLCKATMDPATGAIVRFRAEGMRYFNRGYYAGRWSHSGPVNKGERVSAGVAT